MCIYFVLALIVGVNAIFFSNNHISRIGKGVLWLILIYREIKILHNYRTVSKANLESIDKPEFHKTYRPYRIKVMAIWLIFVGVCIAGKFIENLSADIYFCVALFFFFLDLAFINILCPLKLLSDPKKKAVTCCCGCPCRGWDILMINTPLFFAISSKYLYEEILTIIVILIGIVTFIQWERMKYVLVVNKKIKCAHSCNLSRCIEYKV